ncbi:MAG: Sec-independent protein translocase protein TatB [Pseudomonadota bacterium]|nr:Sec-independent protein translocase protein TatB [Pseudomonadota bacterium]
MFDLGWSEFLIIGFVLMMVVGPKDLPKVLRTFSKLTSQARSMAREFTSSLEDATKGSEMGDVKKFVTDLKTGNLEDMATIIDDDTKKELENIKSTASVDDIGDDVREIQKSAKSDPKPDTKTDT